MESEVKKPKFLEVKLVGTSALKFVLANGQFVAIDANDLNDVMRQAAMMHGINQKVRDAAASCSKGNNFAQAAANMQKVIDNLMAGVWNAQGGGGSAGIVMEDLAHAIATFKSAPYEKAFAAVKAATPEKRAEWAKNPRIAAAMAEAKARRLAAAAAEAEDELDIDLGDGAEDADADE